MNKHRHMSSSSLDRPPCSKKPKVSDDDEPFEVESTMTSSSASQPVEDTRAENKAQASMLLKLPAEIRQQILREMIPQKQKLEIWVFLKRTIGPNACYFPNYFITGPWLPLKWAWNLLLVCKALNEDVMHMFYGGNTFIFNLNFSAPPEFQHAGGACFYDFSGMAHSMKVSSRVASYIRNCEASFTGYPPGAPRAKNSEATVISLRKWLATFMATFKDEHQSQMSIQTEHMLENCWAPVWSGPLDRYAGTNEQHLATMIKGKRRRFRAVLSRILKIS